MIRHYIKIAFRNLLKYKTQSIINILGLAIGFVCFALSSLWIRYEMTYDSFHQNAERIYIISCADSDAMLGRTFSTPSMLGQYLKENLPEVEEAGYAYGYVMDYINNEEVITLNQLTANWDFLRMFNIDILQESGDFRNRDKREVGITNKAAKEVLHTNSPIGQQLDRYGNKITIGALVTGWSEHSLIPFDLISVEQQGSWLHDYSTYVKLEKDINRKDFEEKLASIRIEKEDRIITGLRLTPISSYRHSKYYQYTLNGVKFNHIIYFAVLGLLVIGCALFNYLTLYVNNLQIRNKEFMVRKVNGSGNSGLLIMLLIEFALTMLLALFMGMVMLELAMPFFRKITQVAMVDTKLYIEILFYILCAVLLILPVSLFLIRYSKSANNRNIFRRVSVTFQLTISIGLIFCTVVMMKQLHFLNQTDGVNRKNKASIGVWSAIDKEELHRFIAGLPMVEEVLPMNYFSIIPDVVRVTGEVEEWEGKPPTADKQLISYILADDTYAAFYNLKLLQGEMINEYSLSGEVVLNETAVKSFGWINPIGKQFKIGNSVYSVAGVIQDFQINSPTMKMPAIVLLLPREEEHLLWRSDIIFSYQEGTWNECEKQIGAFIRSHYPDGRLFIHNTQEKYDRLMQSEAILMRLLFFIAVVCVLISFFGVYSFVTLNCEQRRKEMAIRKVNGAIIKDIVMLFLKSYSIMLIIAGLVGFVSGYLVMKPWIEEYVRQTPIHITVYILVFTGVACVIALSIMQPIGKVVKQNPAEIIKSE